MMRGERVSMPAEEWAAFKGRLAEAERLLRMAQYDPYDHDRTLTDDEWCAAWRAFFGLTDSAPAAREVPDGR